MSRPKTDREIIAEFVRIRKPYFDGYPVMVERMNKLCLQLGEITQQAREADQDLKSCMKAGQPMSERFADLKLVQGRLADCFYDISKASLDLAKLCREHGNNLGKILSP